MDILDIRIEGPVFVFYRLLPGFCAGRKWIESIRPPRRSHGRNASRKTWSRKLFPLTLFFLYNTSGDRYRNTIARYHRAAYGFIRFAHAIFFILMTYVYTVRLPSISLPDRRANMLESARRAPKKGERDRTITTRAVGKKNHGRKRDSSAGNNI